MNLTIGFMATETSLTYGKKKKKKKKKNEK